MRGRSADVSGNFGSRIKSIRSESQEIQLQFMNSDEFLVSFEAQHLSFIAEQLENGAEVSDIRKDLWKCIAQHLNTKDIEIKEMVLDILSYVAMSSEHVIKSLQFLQLHQKMFNIISCERNANIVTSAIDVLVEMLDEKPLVCANLGTSGRHVIESAVFVLEKVSSETDYFIEEIDTGLKNLISSALRLFSVAISVFDPGTERAEEISGLFEDFFSDDRYRMMTIQAMYTVSYYQPAIASTCFSNAIPCIMHGISSTPLPPEVFESCIGVMNNLADFSAELATAICLSPDFIEIPIISGSKNFPILMTTLLRAAVATSNSDMLLQLHGKFEQFAPEIFDGFSRNKFSERVSSLRLARQMLETADMSIIGYLFPENSPDFIYTLLDMAESLDREVLELCAESILILLRIYTEIDIRDILLSYDISDIVSSCRDCTNKTVLAFQAISEILNAD